MGPTPRKCSKCGHDLEPKAVQCPECKTPAINPLKGCGIGCAVIVAVGAIVGTVLALSSGSGTDVVKPQGYVQAVNNAPPRVEISQSTYDQIKVGMTYDEVIRIIGTAGKVDATTETPDETGRKVKDEIVIWMTPHGIVGVNLFDGKVLLKYHNASHLRQDPVPL